MALIFLFLMHFKMSSAVCFNLDQYKTLSSGNGLTAVMDVKSGGNTCSFVLFSLGKRCMYSKCIMYTNSYLSKRLTVSSSSGVTS